MRNCLTVLDVNHELEVERERERRKKEEGVTKITPSICYCIDACIINDHVSDMNLIPWTSPSPLFDHFFSVIQILYKGSKTRSQVGPWSQHRPT